MSDAGVVVRCCLCAGEKRKPQPELGKGKLGNGYKLTTLIVMAAVVEQFFLGVAETANELL